MARYELLSLFVDLKLRHFQLLVIADPGSRHEVAQPTGNQGWLLSTDGLLFFS